MTYSNTSPRIPLEALKWNPCGPDDDPDCRLLAHINIAGLDMHLEAWEIDQDDHDFQSVREETMRSDDFDTLASIMDCRFETITIDEREYVLVATPYGA